MVPKGQGEKRNGRGKGKKRKAKAAEGGRTRGQVKATGSSLPPAFVDPNLAVVIKHPIRAQIVAIAHQRAISPSEYAKESGISLSTASGHFKALRDADFLELVEEVPVRGTVKHMYRATRRAYISASDWGKLGDAIQKSMGAAVLQDFNGRVTDALESGTFQSRDDVVLVWLALVLDEISWPKFIEVLTWAISEARELEVETVERRTDGKSEGCFPVTFGVAGFESPKESERSKAGRKGKGSRNS